MIYIVDQEEKEMPASFCGTWEMLSNSNLDGYMIALGKALFHTKIIFMNVNVDINQEHVT